MHRVVIVTMDATRARVFLYERSSLSDGMTEGMFEIRDLVDPGRRAPTNELFSSFGTLPANLGGAVLFDIEDRTAHARLDATFAGHVITTIEEAMRSANPDRIVLCAKPYMLGVLRTAGIDTQVPIEEIPCDLVKFAAPTLLARLRAYGLLPAMRIDADAPQPVMRAAR